MHTSHTDIRCLFNTRIQVDGNMAKVFSYSVPSSSHWAPPRKEWFQRSEVTNGGFPGTYMSVFQRGEVQFGRPRGCSLLLLLGLITHHSWARRHNLGFLWLLGEGGQTEGGTCLTSFCVILSSSLVFSEGCLSLIRRESNISTCADRKKSRRSRKKSHLT